MLDLRVWLKEVEKLNELRKINGADWNLEIGCVTAINWKTEGHPALLFDNIKSYPSGFKVLTCSTSTPSRTKLTMAIPHEYSNLESVDFLREKLPYWENIADKFQPHFVESGPILENCVTDKEVDLFKFPVPKWHELDGGRYIGTGDVVITTDPDTKETNLGTYRIMIHDSNTCALYISPGHHGRVHYEKYHNRGERCPVAVAIGSHPLIFRIAGSPVASGMEYKIIGAISGESVKVIKEELTGLLIPVNSEIVLVGWCPPDKAKMEGPFGEWTGYYASGERPTPIIEVERIYYRNNPIILGCPPGRPPSESDYYRSLVWSALLHNDLLRCGVPDIKGVWVSKMAGQLLIIISIKQRYAGHAKQAAIAASQGSLIGAFHGRYVVVVDEDIDPSNIDEVVWALCTRSDPEKDIDIIRRTWSTPLDPTIRKPAPAFFNSRAIIDACKPYEWISEFPKVIEYESNYINEVRRKWFKTI